MALSRSQWLNKYPKCFVLPVKQIIHGKYLCSVQFRMPGANLLRYGYINKSDIEQFKRDVTNHYDNRRWGVPNIADEVVALWKFYKSAEELKVKTRIEGSSLTLYFETEAEMLSNIDHFVALSVDGKPRKIMAPLHDSNTAALVGNKIVVGKPTAKYRAVVKAGRYSIDTGKAIVGYCSQNNIPLTDHVASALTSGTYVSRNKIDLDDTKFLTFLTLISPKFVSKFYELEQAK